jgi:hypothetical protein
MADAKRVIEAIEELRPFPPDTPIVRQINAAKAVPFQGFDECFWNPKTNEALSIDDVDVDPAFVRAVLIFIPDDEFKPDVVAQANVPEGRTPEQEVKRLTDALHERHIHPDYEYATTKTARKSGDSRKPEGDGWEPNVYGDDPHSAWERFEFHEEEYWRRLKPTSPRASS